MDRPEIVEMKLEDINGAPYNPRAISEMALNGLKGSIERYGLVEPLVWNRRTNTLVAGHARMKALRAMGVEVAQCVVVDLDPMEERSLNVTLNNPNIMGEFTSDLDGLLEDLEGWNDEAFQALNLDLLQVEVLGIVPIEEPAFEPPDPSEQDKRKVLLGQVWKVGLHRLACGSSHDDELLRLLMGDRAPDVTIIDPPYGSDLPWIDHLQDPSIVWGNGRDLLQIPAELYRFERVLVKTGTMNRGFDQLSRNHAIMVQVGSVRTIPKIGKRKARGSVVNSVFHRDEYEEDGKRFGKHEKPVKMLVENLSYYTPPWEVCFDPYSGSGSTFLACEHMRKVCYGVELDPIKCGIILDRLQAATKAEPVLVV